jgi:hypothetical protein
MRRILVATAAKLLDFHLFRFGSAIFARQIVFFTTNGAL